MKKEKKIYTFINKLSAICMILALLWLTVSAPFVLGARQQLAKLDKKAYSSSIPANEEESTNPFGNNTEEKAPSGTSFSEEYLHDYHTHHHFVTEILQHFGKGDADTYTAYHGELDAPPPDIS